MLEVVLQFLQNKILKGHDALGFGLNFLQNLGAFKHAPTTVAFSAAEARLTGIKWSNIWRFTWNLQYW